MLPGQRDKRAAAETAEEELSAAWVKKGKSRPMLLKKQWRNDILALMCGSEVLCTHQEIQEGSGTICICCPVWCL